MSLGLGGKSCLIQIQNDELLLEASQQYEALTADSEPPPEQSLGRFGPPRSSEDVELEPHSVTTGYLSSRSLS